MASSIVGSEREWENDVHVRQLDRKVRMIQIPMGKLGEPGGNNTFPGTQELLRYVRMNGCLPLGYGDAEPKKYIPRLSRDVSLHRCEGEDAATAISFTALKDLNLDHLESLNEGDYIDSSEIVPLYHSHVLWCYVIRLSRVKGDKYSLSIVSVGSHLSAVKKERPVGSRNNDLPGLEPPTVAEGSLKINNVAGDTFEMLEFKRSDNDSFSLGRQFTAEELIDYAQYLPYTRAKMSLVMVLNLRIPPSYFSLASIIDLEAHTTVSASTWDTVAGILRGEKPPGCDWEITTSTSAPVYHVHKATFTRASPMIKEVLGTGKVGKFEKIELVNGGKRGVLCAFDDAAVRMAIHIAYGLPIPLPETRAEPLIEQMSSLFDADHFDRVVLKQWEREICRKVLALDARNPSSSSMAQLLHLLDVIWSAPYGSMPVAKRVAVGVMADMMHLSNCASADQFVRESVLPYRLESGCSFEHLFTILASMAKLLDALSLVPIGSQSGPIGSVSGSSESDSSIAESFDFDFSGEDEESDTEEEEEEVVPVNP